MTDEVASYGIDCTADRLYLTGVKFHSTIEKTTQKPKKSGIVFRLPSYLEKDGANFSFDLGDKIIRTKSIQVIGETNQIYSGKYELTSQLNEGAHQVVIFEPTVNFAASWLDFCLRAGYGNRAFNELFSRNAGQRSLVQTQSFGGLEEGLSPFDDLGSEIDVATNFGESQETLRRTTETSSVPSNLFDVISELEEQGLSDALIAEFFSAPRFGDRLARVVRNDLFAKDGTLFDRNALATIHEYFVSTALESPNSLSAYTIGSNVPVPLQLHPRKLKSFVKRTLQPLSSDCELRLIGDDNHEYNIPFASDVEWQYECLENTSEGLSILNSIEKYHLFEIATESDLHFNCDYARVFELIFRSQNLAKKKFTYRIEAQKAQILNPQGAIRTRGGQIQYENNFLEPLKNVIFKDFSFFGGNLFSTVRETVEHDLFEEPQLQFSYTAREIDVPPACIRPKGFEGVFD